MPAIEPRFITLVSNTVLATIIGFAAIGNTQSVIHSITPSASKISPLTTPDYALTIKPLIVRYCAPCHSGSKPQSGIDLAKYTNTSSVLSDATTWQNVLTNLRSQHMPPPGLPQPSPNEREMMSDWIDKTLAQNNCDLKTPGRVTMRRLNRQEYNNTVRDLLGVDLHPADHFPSDDVGYGFDNIGDVLSMSPLLLEKYLNAADMLAHAAIITPESFGKTVQFSPTDLQTFGAGTGINASGDMALYTNAEVGVTYHVPIDGLYTLCIRAYAEQAGDQIAQMELRLDHKSCKTTSVKNDITSPGVFEVTVPLTAGDHIIGAAFNNDFYDPNAPNPKLRDRNLFIRKMAITGPIGKPTRLPDSETRIIRYWPKSKSEYEQCARQNLAPFASRAYRRPITSDELDRLITVFDRTISSGGSFERGIQIAVEATLVSANFLFLVEHDPDNLAQGVSHPLSSYEIASRLSYFLWSTMPDQELFDHAAQNQLQKPKILNAEVSRMLASPKSNALATDFGGQWLQLRKLAVVAPDTKRFPLFDENLRTAMRTETELYFENIIHQDRSILDFIDSDYTFLNDDLAHYYGIDGVTGSNFREVKLLDHNRGGVLTQASVLTVTSNPTRTSPVKRGRWVLEQILGAPPPPPPPGVPQLDDSRAHPLTGTLRERMIQHRSDPACAACHQSMDPIGFGLENYDAVGHWRTTDENVPIDASGVLPDGSKFQGPTELKGILMSKKSQFVRALSEKMLVYATGRGMNPSDACYVQAIAKSVEKNNYRFSALIDAVVESPAFRERSFGQKHNGVTK